MIPSDATVFVVDDDVSVRRGLERLLRSAGYRVATDDSAGALLARGDLERPCCVVLDVRMPGQSGLELQRTLSTRHPGLPVVLISGHGDDSMALRALDAGAVAFLAKPFDDEVLLEAVARAITCCGAGGTMSRTTR